MQFEIPFQRLIDCVRAEMGDPRLPVVVGQDVREETIFAKAKGVRVDEPFASVSQFMFWSIPFCRMAVRLREAIEQQEAAHG